MDSWPEFFFRNIFDFPSREIPAHGAIVVCFGPMLFQYTDNPERELKPAQTVEYTAAEKVNAIVFAENFLVDN